MPEYREIRQQLWNIKRAVGIRYLFTMVEDQPEQYMYIIDGFPLQYQGNDISLPGDIEQNTYDHLIRTFEKKEITQGELSYSEEWGANVSTFIPLFDNEEHFVGVLGTDIDGSEVYQLMAANKRKIIYMTILAIGLGLMISYFITKYLVAPIKQLTRKVVQVKKGNLQTKINIKRTDEIGLLADAFNDMVSTFYYNELNKKAKDLQEKNKWLAQINNLKDEFLAKTSHELRTPLNGIIGIGESIIDGIGGPINKTIQNNIETIISGAKRLNHLVNDILDYSKLKHKDIQLFVKPLDLSSVTDAVLTISKPLLINQKVELINHVETPTLILADDNRIQQILYNLISNAIKYTEKGRIDISSRILEQFVEITIADTGIGIPEDKFSVIFKSYEQLDHSAFEEFPGTGLGLSITKYLIELHGGRIHVESAVGKGSKFIFTIPKAVDEIPLQPLRKLTLQPPDQITDHVMNELAKNEAAVSVENPQDHSIRILVVEDDSTNIQVIVNHFTMKKWKPLITRDGIEALQIIASQNVDLVLLDVMLPKMSGFEVCQKIRDQYSSNELPVILLTAKNSMEDFIQGFYAGANDYLPKPFTKEELIARIQAHIDVAKACVELKMMREYVKTGTSCLRHAFKNDLEIVNLFTRKIEEYAAQHHIEPLQKATSIVMNKNKHLLSLMKRVNHLTSELVLVKEKRNIKQTVENVIESFKPKLAKHRIQVHKLYEQPILSHPIYVEYDPVHIEEVLLNIINNSVEAMAQNGGEIYIEIVSETENVIITIRDTGSGISNEHLPHIMELYYSTKQEKQNFGIGLFYCERVMKKHGGSVYIHSEVGKGTSVELIFN